MAGFHIAAVLYPRQYLFVIAVAKQFRPIAFYLTSGEGQYTACEAFHMHIWKDKVSAIINDEVKPLFTFGLRPVDSLVARRQHPHRCGDLKATDVASIRLYEILYA